MKSLKHFLNHALLLKLAKSLKPPLRVELLAAVTKSEVALACHGATRSYIATRCWKLTSFNYASAKNWLLDLIKTNAFTTALIATILDDEFIASKQLEPPELVTPEAYVKYNAPSKLFGYGFFGDNPLNASYLTIWPKALTELSYFNLESLFSRTAFEKMTKTTSTLPLAAPDLLKALISFAWYKHEF